MSKTVLLLDFGASRTKGAVLSLEDGKFLEFNECISPTPIVGTRGEVEVNPLDYWQSLENVALPLLSKYPISDVWLCVEMHGFLLCNGDEPRPITNYISWKDERATFDNDHSGRLIDELKEENKTFRKQTGMNIKPGLPYVNMHAIKEKIPVDCSSLRFCTLADWLLICGGENDPGIHETLAAGTGFYSIIDGKWSESLLSKVGMDHERLRMPRVVRAGCPLGVIQVGAHRLNVYGGVGDLQAALYGAGFPYKHQVLINLGTGSQVVSMELDATDETVELRPGILGGRFSAITHIPSGRALNVFAKFIDDLAPSPVFWDAFAALKTDDLKSSGVSINVAVFASSWQYKSGGSISGINEINFNLKHYVGAVAKGWLDQYKNAIDAICIKPVKSIAIAGGLSRRASFVAKYLADITSAQIEVEEYDTGEDTLEGLKFLANAAYNER